MILSLLLLVFGSLAEMDRKTEHEIIKDLKVEEGFRSKPYKDTQGKWTVGFGRNLTGRALTVEEHTLLFPESDGYPLSINTMVILLKQRPMTVEQALILLKNDLEICKKDAITVYGDRWLSFPRDIKVSVLDLLFNLGLPRYLGFKKHIKALELGDYDEAAHQILNSRAYKQLPKRYQIIADRIRMANPDPSPSVSVINFPEDAHFWTM